MASHKRQLRLGAFLQGVGHHLAAWCHPDVNPNDIFNPQRFVRLQATANQTRHHRAST